MFGTALGQNIETLQKGNFEQLIGERLNKFFQTGVARGEELQDLYLRAEEINGALKEVCVQMEKLNPETAKEAQQYRQRIDTLATELSGLQTQLQNRRATVETTLRIPVSTYVGARQTFLDELGRGIKREVNKLNDPESYFASELEHLITTDIVALVDLCDQKIAYPGSSSELESSLTQLFEQAGLRDIVPRQGDPFKMAEQDLIQMVTEVPGKSLTVAQVIKRGFFYKQRTNEILLRKAGVTAYR